MVHTLPSTGSCPGSPEPLLVFISQPSLVSRDFSDIQGQQHQCRSRTCLQYVSRAEEGRSWTNVSISPSVNNKALDDICEYCPFCTSNLPPFGSCKCTYILLLSHPIKAAGNLKYSSITLWMWITSLGKPSFSETYLLTSWIITVFSRSHPIFPVASSACCKKSYTFSNTRDKILPQVGDIKIIEAWYLWNQCLKLKEGFIILSTILNKI